MRKLSVKQIVQATAGRLVSGPTDFAFDRLSTDSRSLQPGDLFFALKGERFDGHDHVHEAIQRKARGLVVSRLDPVAESSSQMIILVEDTLQALGALAAYYRTLFELPVVAVTGSTGKTTTKEMIAAILATRWKVLKSKENFNNEVGVPMTLFELEDAHQGAVVELAMRGPGQIDYLARMVKPKVGVITNIGHSHIELLKSVEAIAEAKGELLQVLEKQGTAILNGDDPMVSLLKRKATSATITFGLDDSSADYRGQAIRTGWNGSTFQINTSLGKQINVKLPLLGKHNVLNALAAAAAVEEFGFTLEEIARGLGTMQPTSHRLQILKGIQGCLILDDSYNASPDSVRAALQVLKELPVQGRRLAVIGDMRELGDREEQLHQEVGREMIDYRVNQLVTVGPLARCLGEVAMKSGLSTHQVVDWQEAADLLLTLLGPEDLVLVKGSHVMNLDRLVEQLLCDNSTKTRNA